MSTAEFPYRVLIDTNDVGVSTHALDARTARIVISNLNHLSDEFGQVCVNMSGTTAALSGKAGYLTPGTPAFVTTFYFVTSFKFPIKVRAGGQSYKFRIRIGGASGNTAATSFLAGLGPGIIRLSGASGGTTDNFFRTADTTTTTAAWLTGASLGPNAYTRMIEMAPDQVSRCVVDRETLVALGGAPASVEVALVTLNIWATTANVTHVPRLYSVYLAEVIGL